MCYTVIPTENFEKDVKYYVKTKGFRNIGKDIKVVTDELEKGILIGAPISGLHIDLDSHTYKVRSVNTDMKVGKSNGYRIIYYVVKDDREIYLLTIYSKKDKNRFPSNYEIFKLVNEYCINSKEQDT